MAIGIVLFMIAVLRGNLSSCSLGIKSSAWLVPYLCGLLLISYLGAFGGKNIIPFGWDFLVIGIFSLVIFYLAVKSRADISEDVIAEQASLIPLF
jgi:hypothetical protein